MPRTYDDWLTTDTTFDLAADLDEADEPRPARAPVAAPAAHDDDIDF